MIVLGTTVVSYIFNRDSRARFYQQRFQGRPPFISFQTLEEQWSGAYHDRWGSGRRSDLSRYLEEYEVVWPDAGLVNISGRGFVLNANYRHRTHGLPLPHYPCNVLCSHMMVTLKTSQNWH